MESENSTEENKITKWPYMTLSSLTKSIVFKLTIVGFVWGFGYMHWNFAWLIPAIVFIEFQSERKNYGDLKRMTAQATALANEELIIRNRLDELPTWVNFPDYDRAEWLNAVS